MVQENLEGCRMSLEAREAELAEASRRMVREAVRRKQQGDVQGAKAKLLERRRAQKRLDRLRNSLALVDAQIDALQSTELDRELMNALAFSSAALKKAGVGKGVKEAEAVMSELDEQMRESCELTSVLSGALQEDAEFDVDEELAELMKETEVAGAEDIGRREKVGDRMQVADTSREVSREVVPPVAVNRQIVVNGWQQEEARPELGRAVVAPGVGRRDVGHMLVSGI